MVVEEEEEVLRKVKAGVGSSQKLISATNACVSYQFIASHLHVPLSMPCMVMLKLNPLAISSLSIEGATRGRRAFSWFCCACPCVFLWWVEGGGAHHL